MKNVMWNGQLQGTIHLDCISNKQNLYGWSPIEYLNGEALIYDGIAYRSKVVNDPQIEVVTDYDIKAPFFTYANIKDREAYALPNHVLSLHNLEKHLDSLTQNSERSFLF